MRSSLKEIAKYRDAAMKCPKCNSPGQEPGKSCDNCGFVIPTAHDAETVVLEGMAFAGQSLGAGERIGNYEVIRELGRGGMGVVYLVRNVISDKEYALKLIRPELSQSREINRRFISEVTTSQELLSRNIVRVFQPELDGEQLFFTMEHVPGRSLRALLEGRKGQVPPFTVDEACQILLPVLQALEHVHSRRPPVVHRDLKPENIMVVGEFPEIRVKVLDFGLAKVLSPSRLTKSAVITGTAYYMAPEQLKAATVDHHADLYAVGVILFELLTGDIPQGFFDLPGQTNPDVPSSLDDLLRKCLASNPSARPGGASQVRKALEGIQREANAPGQTPAPPKEDPPPAAEPAPEPESPAKYALTVRPTPADATVKILNIGPRYEDGIKLEPDRYHVEVSKAGYQTVRQWVGLTDSNREIEIALEKKKGPSRGDIWTDPATGMEFVWVPKGCFQMGSNSGDDDEKPVHEVCVDGLWMGKFEVTRGQFREFVRQTGYRSEAETGGGAFIWTGSKWEKKAGYYWDKVGFDQDDSHPVVTVSWNDAQAFVKWLSGKGNGTFRLPTEAEWEYAARSGGRDETYSGGNDVDRVAWYGKNSGKKTHAVGSKAPNGLDLYDMSGNVWEWVQDWYAKDAYQSHSRNNPIRNNSASGLRVLRGGSWDSDARFVRCASRYGVNPGSTDRDSGFRLVRLPQE